MTTELNGQKEALREHIRNVLQKMSPALRMAESIQLCARLEPQLQSAHTILFFAPLPDEPDVWPLLEKLLPTQKICALPAFNPTFQSYSARQVRDLKMEIAVGKFGIREPCAGCPEISPGDLDLILVPGVAFDLNGRRLGRGQGFYDRLLAKVRGIKCGVAFDQQIVKVVTAETHDVRMDFILTPTLCIKT